MRFLLLIYVLIISYYFYSCHHKKEKINEVPIKETDSRNNNIPDFVNSLNLPELAFPIIGHYSSPDQLDTIDFDVKDDPEYLYDFSIFPKGQKKKALNITIASEIHLYDEGDLDGDGTQEIGIIPGYNTSSCRNYLIYSFKNGNWKLLYTISSHLADREQGIDYVKREGDRIRILSADDGCCQCFGLDTLYEKIKK